MDLISRLLQAFADHCQQADAAHADQFAELRGILLRIEAKLDAAWPAITERIDRMSSTLDTDLNDLDSRVADLTTEVESATTFMDGIQSYIQAAVRKDQAAGATPEQLAHVTQAAASIGALKDKLAASILKNTPGDPAPSAGGQQPAPGEAPAPASPASADPAAPAAVATDPTTSEEATLRSGAPLPAGAAPPA